MNGRIPVVENYVKEKQNGGRGYYWTYDEIKKTREDIRKNLPLHSPNGSSHLFSNKATCTLGSLTQGRRVKVLVYENIVTQALSSPRLNHKISCKRLRYAGFKRM